MHASLRVRLRQVSLFVVLLGVALASNPGGRAAAQEPAMRWDGLIELISGWYNYPPPTVDPPVPADNASTMSRRAISADGRYILFNTEATNLGYSGPGLYLRDRRTNETRALLAGPALNGTLSADGNHVAFEICDPYARPQPRPDGALFCDVYALDVRTWQWTLMSGMPDGTFGDEDSRAPVLSSDGRFVVFRTKAGNLSGGTPGIMRLVLRDRDADGNGIFDEPGTALLETISVGPNDSILANDDSDTPEVSDDGRFVAFRSRATNLVSGDHNGAWDIFLRDRPAHRTRRINLRGGVEESFASIDSPQISMTPDGRYIAYTSADPMLAPAVFDDLNGVNDVFVYDRVTSSTSRVDVGWGPPVAEGIVPGNGPTEWPTLSADGRYVALQSAATNVQFPALTAGTRAYVVDRTMQTVTRVGIRPDGVEPDADSTKPSLSADGSLVAFLSQATNLAPQVYWPVDRIYAAVHLDLSPAEVVVPGSGGSATFTVTTQQYTQWWLDWAQWEYWWQLEAPPMGVGNGEIRFRIPDPNPDPARRSYTVRVHSKTALLTQLEGMSLTSVSPTSGPDAGGTQVTVTGTGFEPGVRVVFDGYEAVTEFVDSTTLIATTPPHAPATVWVATFSADYRQNAWIDQAFRYTDTTPPEVYGWTDSGEEGEGGWYRSDVWANFWWWDPQSTVTSTDGCGPFLVNTDTPGTTFTCRATSEGGTGSASITVKRDTAPPTVAISAPAAGQLYEQGVGAVSSFTCSDALSGVAQCGVSAPSGAPIDTLVPGWHTFYADGRDVAGNFGVGSVEYAVSTDVCVPGLTGMRGWWRMEGNTRNTRSNITSEAIRVGLPDDIYVDAIVGQGYRFTGPDGYLDTRFAFRIPGNLNFALTAWVRPSANTLGTILRKKDQYSIARTASGNLAWAFRKYNNPTLTYFDTGVKMPLNAWSHIAVVLDHAEVRTYLNGRLAHTATGIGDVYTWDNMYDSITIGGAADRGDYFKGVLDELKVFEQTLSAATIEQLFLAGPAGACPPKATQFYWNEPLQATYQASTYPFEVKLLDENFQPVVGKSIRLESIVGAWPYSTSSTTRVTDENGRVYWDAPLKGAPPGFYDDYTSVTFDGDSDYVRAYAEPGVVVNKATPVITWPTPAAITYGTPLSATQLNATANVSGTFSYLPPSGTVLPAGTHELAVGFTPWDTTYYNSTTGSTALTVNKRTPAISVTGGTFTYDGQPHAATGTVTGLGGASLGPLTFTYNGSPDAPVAAGTYDVLGTFAGDVNYNAVSRSATITIAKASPVLTWSTPAAIVYGTPLGATQLNATANVPGTFAYSPAAGTVLNAGAGQTLSATFTPADATNYSPATVTTTVDVTKATPSMNVSGGSFVYDGAPHGASGVATGVGGEQLSPISFTYNASSAEPVNAGVYDVVATYAGSANYLGASATATLTITKAAVTLSWAPPPAIVYGTTLGVAQLNATASVPGSFVYTPSAGTVLNAGTGQSLSAAFTPTDSTNFNGGNVSTTIDVAKATAVVTATGGTFTYDGQPHPASGTVTGAGGASLGPLTFTYNGAAEAPVNAGIYNVVATFGGDANHEGASGVATIAIAKASVNLSWNMPSAIVYGTSLSATQLNATANVAGAFVYTPAAGTALNAGAGQTLSAAFTPSDGANYNSAEITTTLDVAKATPAMSVSGGTFVYDGAPHAASGFVTGVGGEQLGPISYTYNGSSAEPVNAGVYDVVGIYGGNANYLAATATAAVTITKASVTLSWATPSAIVYGTALSGAQLNATANVAGSFTYLPAVGTVLNSGVGQALSATFTPADSTNYDTAVVGTTIDVSKATVSVSWPAPSAIVYGTPLSATQLNATANVAGAFVYTPSAGTLLNAGSAQTLSAAFTPADSTNYEPAVITTTVDVGKAAPSISVNGGTSVYDGAPHAASGLVTGVGGEQLGPIVFTYNGSSAEPVNAGVYDVVGTYAGNANYLSATATSTVTITRATVTLSWPTPSSIVYGTPLGAGQLNATASVAGSFVYTPSAGTVLNTGANQTLSATFTPSDPGNYTGSTVETTITVSPAALTVRANDATKRFGAPLPAFTAAFAGFVNGDSPASLSGALTFGTTATQQSAVGTYPIVPSGLASMNYAITFANGALFVVKGAVAVNVSTSPEPSGLDQSMTFTATVAAASPAAGLPSGNVNFVDGGTLLGTASLVGGTASLTTAGLSAGSHAIEAQYEGDSSFEPGTGASSHSVNDAASTPVLTVTSSRNPSSTGQAVTFTANASMTSGAVTGSVEFWDGATLLGTSVLSAGRATLTTSALSNGSHAIRARYAGSSSAPPVISAVFVQAVGGNGWKNRTSTATVASSANPAPLGTTITFTATIVGSSGSVPTGRVLFMVNDVVIGDPAGVPVTFVSGTTVRATLEVPGLAHGAHRVAVTYLGDVNYKGSTSAVSQIVN